ncbi:MAG: WYL domain-containing protein [Bacteroidia bacterium]
MVYLLGDRPGKTIAQLSESLQVDQRSIYRYLNILEEQNYCVEKDTYGRYFLFSPDDASSGLHEEEVQLVRTLLESAAPANPLTPGILGKLPTPEKRLIHPLINIQAGKISATLFEACKEKMCVQLIQYQSVSSGKVSDRLVEPLEFDVKSGQLVAFDPEAGLVKQFKASRILDVELLNQPRQYKKNAHLPDMFHMSGSRRIRIVLHLTHRAYRLMVEEFPETSEFITRREGDDFNYEFCAQVNAYEGVGRFVLGLPGEIKVAGTAGFKEYIKKKIGMGWGISE